MDILREFDAYDVFEMVGFGGRAMADGSYVIKVLNDSLGEKEAEYELEVMARGSHGDGQFALGAVRGRTESEVDGEGFFSGEQVLMSRAG